jgi:hypothetical protein
MSNVSAILSNWGTKRREGEGDGERYIEGNVEGSGERNNNWEGNTHISSSEIFLVLPARPSSNGGLKNTENVL